MEGVNDQSPNAATLHTTEGHYFNSFLCEASSCAGVFVRLRHASGSTRNWVCFQ